MPFLYLAKPMFTMSESENNETDDDETPHVTQLWSMLSFSLNPYTGSPLGWVNIFLDGRILFEMDRESFFDEVAWSHEFTEFTIAHLIYSHCTGSYMMCKCDVDCRIPINWLDDDIEIQLPIAHFVSSLTTSCNLPTRTGFEKVDGDRVWDLASEFSKNANLNVNLEKN
ncbi:MAG: hypothetical protein ACFFER_12470 [Candidatus Thorarchaeota archaeon]